MVRRLGRTHPKLIAATIAAASLMLGCASSEPDSGPIDTRNLWRAWESQDSFFKVQPSDSVAKRVVDFYRQADNSLTRYQCPAGKADTCFRSYFHAGVLQGDSTLNLSHAWDIDYDVRIRVLTPDRLVYAFRTETFRFAPNTRVLVDTAGGA
jgi:hypothetical protein